MHVPDRHAAGSQAIVRVAGRWRLRPHRSHQGSMPSRSLGAGASCPPSGIAFHVDLTAFLPYGECAVVEDERLAGLGDDAHVILSRERHQSVPAGKQPRRILPRSAYGRAVVVDHPLNLTVSRSTPDVLLDYLVAAEALGQLVGDLFVPALLDKRGGGLDVLNADHRLAADL